MIRFALGFIAALAATPAAAEFCDELWFVRNLVFDRAGFCFGSELGAATFDNADCLGSDVTLSSEARDIVTSVRQQETWMNCAVDTSRRRLDVPDAAMIRALDDLPVPTDTASACITWSGPDFPLYAGHTTGSRITAVVRAGFDIYWEYDHLGPEGWQVLSLYRDYERVAIGWSRTFINPDFCEMMAG